MQSWFFPAETKKDECGRLLLRVLNSRRFELNICVASWETPTHTLPSAPLQLIAL